MLPPIRHANPIRGAKSFLEESRRFEGTPACAAVITGIGAMDCTLEETIERHGVYIVIGRVVDVLNGGGDAPLIHFRGGYLP